MKKLLSAIFLVFFIFPSFLPSTDSPPEVVSDIQTRIGQFPKTVIDYDRTLLNENEKKVVDKLIEAARYMDDIFWRQVWKKNPEYRERLLQWAKDSKPHQKALIYFDLMKGKWDRLKHNEPFLAPFGEEGRKSPGAGFYPENISKEAIEKWIQQHPDQKEAFQNLFTVVKEENGRLYTVPYSEEYARFLKPAAKALREAAKMTENKSLQNYLELRAEAFSTNNYYESDVAWIDLDSPIEVVIGPYEVYEDQMFNWKASFEAFITVVDRQETDRLKEYTRHLTEMEKNLPIPDEHKNLNRGTDTAIRVVQEIFTAGDARRGVQTAAFNLPNDETVRQKKGFKNVLLKNVMEAKFKQSGLPIAARILDSSQQKFVNFSAYFNHILFHELSHGLGPGIITGPDGKKVENRLLLKELYSSIEECKADVVSAWNLLYAMKNRLVTDFDETQLAVTNAGLMFRSMRFGLGEAHGRGTAVQWNWFREKNAIVPTANGRFRVSVKEMREAVKSLARELLMIEATGDYNRARALLDKYGRSTGEIEKITSSLKDIPVDIAPVFVAAGEKM